MPDPSDAHDRKVVYLIDHPMGQRDYDRFGIQVLLAHGLTVEAWDFSPFLNPKVFTGYQVPDPIRFDGIRIFKTNHEALKAIRRADQGTIFIMLIGYCSKSRAIYRSISQKGLCYGVVLANAVPPEGVKLNDRFKRLLKSPGTLINSLFVRLPAGWFGIQPPNFILAGGTNSVFAYPLLEPQCQIIWCHTLDYDLFLKAQENSEQIQPEYAVFLDEYWPFHADFLAEGLPFPVTPEAYYPKLVNFFERVESDLGLEVVIAAHPRSNYESLPDYYRGRRVIRGKTIQLIRNAKLVLAHNSTSLNFANLYQKPVVFLDLVLGAKFLGYIVEEMATAFGKKPISLTETLNIDWGKELIVDENAYLRYREAYIKKSGSPDKPFWHIVTDFLKERTCQ